MLLIWPPSPVSLQIIQQTNYLQFSGLRNPHESNSNHVKSLIIETSVDGELHRKERDDQLNYSRFARTFGVGRGAQRPANVDGTRFEDDRVCISARVIFGRFIE
jgi:hypothetical protein